MALEIKDFYEKYGPMVLRRCRAMLKIEERALDAMQDVFVNLLKNQHRLEGTYPSSLLYTMATNICLNIIKADNRRPITDNENTLLNIATYDETEKKVIFASMLDKLFKKEKQSTRTIMVLLYIDGMTLEETAEQIGLSVSGVRKRVREFKARAQETKEYLS